MNSLLRALRQWRQGNKNKRRKSSGVPGQLFLISIFFLLFHLACLHYLRAWNRLITIGCPKYWQRKRSLQEPVLASSLKVLNLQQFHYLRGVITTIVPGLQKGTDEQTQGCNWPSSQSIVTLQCLSVLFEQFSSGSPVTIDWSRSILIQSEVSAHGGLKS